MELTAQKGKGNREKRTSDHARAVNSMNMVIATFVAPFKDYIIMGGGACLIHSSSVQNLRWQLTAHVEAPS